ncbi:MAG: cytochrome-c peroxidase [Pseudomonadales bacterium]
MGSRHCEAAHIFRFVALLTVAGWLAPLYGAQPAYGAPPANGTATAQAPAAGFERIGQGDPRDGYESEAFETRSRRLDTTPGAPLALADLAAAPPLGLPALPDPPGRDEIDLGRRLFYDRALSANGTLSCGMCHVPEQAFTQNELATPVGIEGRFVRRNAPALYNVGYRQQLFHDGRETSLAAQIWSPLLAANEMGNGDREQVLARIAADPDYAEAFQTLFGGAPTAGTLGRVLAAYQRALLSANSPFDRWYFGGEAGAMTPAARRGFFTFTEAGCHRCHTFSNRHALFTDDALHRTGVEYLSRRREASPVEVLQVAPGVIIPLAVSVARPDRADEGAFEVSGREDDRWRYRTPSLRNVALTAPYMHDGSLRTLKDVVRFYDTGGGDDPDRDPALQPLGLTDEARSDLVAFLESLTGDNVDALAADARSAPVGDRRGLP